MFAEYKSMRRALVITIPVMAVLLFWIAVVLFHGKPPHFPRTVSVLFLGLTNVSAGARLGGTPGFPLVDLAVLGVTNMPPSRRVGLFLLTNGTSRTAYFDLQGTEVFRDGAWVVQTSEWASIARGLAPGESSIHPVPEPADNLQWRIRLGVQEHVEGAKQVMDNITARNFRTVFFTGQSYQVFSGSILNGRGEPDGPANGSQPIRSETNSTSSAAGSRR